MHFWFAIAIKVANYIIINQKLLSWLINPSSLELSTKSHFKLELSIKNL